MDDSPRPQGGAGPVWAFLLGYDRRQHRRGAATVTRAARLRVTFVRGTAAAAGRQGRVPEEPADRRTAAKSRRPPSRARYSLVLQVIVQPIRARYQPTR